LAYFISHYKSLTYESKIRKVNKYWFCVHVCKRLFAFVLWFCVHFCLSADVTIVAYKYSHSVFNYKNTFYEETAWHFAALRLCPLKPTRFINGFNVVIFVCVYLQLVLWLLLVKSYWRTRIHFLFWIVISFVTFRSVIWLHFIRIMASRAPLWYVWMHPLYWYCKQSIVNFRT